MSAMDGRRYLVGDYLIETARYRISSVGAAVPVEPKVFDLLVYLIRNRDRVVTREELFEKVWEERVVSDATLSNHVMSARKILGDSGELQQTIQTVRGRGYQFIAPVSEVADAADDPARPAAPAPVAGPTGKPRPAWSVPLLAAVLLLAASAGAVVLRHFNTANASVNPARTWLLVVPFDVATVEPRTWQIWADEITRRLVTDLRSSPIPTKERATSFQFVDDKTHAHITKLLPDVRYVLSGKVLVLDGKAPSVIMELDDLQTDKLIWSKTFPNPLQTDAASLAEMQATITAAVTDFLNVTIPEDENRARARLRGPATGNHEAMVKYLEGWKHVQLFDYESLKKAIELFDQAIDKDPGFFDAHLAKGQALRLLYGYYENPAEVLDKVLAAFKKAEDLRPDAAEPLSELGLTYAMAWEWTKAWDYLNRAYEKDPKLATTNLGFALYYSGLGPVRSMKESLYRARVNDPLNPELGDWGNWALFLNEQYDDSHAWAMEMMEKHPGVGFITADAAVGAYLEKDYQRAIDLANKGYQLEATPLTTIIMAQAYGFAGQTKKVRPLLEEAARSTSYTCPYESAVGYLSIGEKDMAMALLEVAYKKKSNCLIFLRVDPRLQPIRDDQRFRKQYLDLLARVGLNEEKWKLYPRVIGETSTPAGSLPREP